MGHHFEVLHWNYNGEIGQIFYLVITLAYLGVPNMVKWGAPEKILQNAVQMRRSVVNRTLQSKVITKSHFWPISDWQWTETNFPRVPNLPSRHWYSSSWADWCYKIFLYFYDSLMSLVATWILHTSNLRCASGPHVYYKFIDEKNLDMIKAGI